MADAAAARAKMLRMLENCMVSVVYWVDSTEGFWLEGLTVVGVSGWMMRMDVDGVSEG